MTHPKEGGNGRREETPTPAEAGTPEGEIPKEVHAMGDRGEPLASAPENPHYTPYHPKWHREPIPITWWTRNRRYTAFILRELTSVLVLYAGVLLVVHLLALSRGPESHIAFQEWLAQPGVVVVHLLVLAGLLFHSVTWLNLAPQAIVPHIRGHRIPPRVVLVAHYLAWIALSAVLLAVLVSTLGARG
jgi:fumarate reductase subunit C